MVNSHKSDTVQLIFSQTSSGLLSHMSQEMAFFLWAMLAWVEFFDSYDQKISGTDPISVIGKNKSDSNLKHNGSVSFALQVNH